MLSCVRTWLCCKDQAEIYTPKWFVACELTAIMLMYVRAGSKSFSAAPLDCLFCICRNFALIPGYCYRGFTPPYDLRFIDRTSNLSICDMWSSALFVRNGRYIDPLAPG
eukprot:6174246-Pleurochrysis_carterae.AAC.4